LIGMRTLSEICDVVAGQHIPAEEHNDSGNGTPYLTGPADFGELIPTVSKWTNHPRQFAKTSDVLITVKGAGVGKSNLGIDAAIGRQLMALRPKPGVLDRNYLLHWVRLNQQRLADLGQGATVPGIGKSALEVLEVPLPSLLEQRRIADILDKADGIRRKSRQAIALTDAVLRSAFLQLVGPAAAGYSTWPSLKVEALAAPTPNAVRTGPFGSDLRHSEFVAHGVAVLGIDNAVQNRFTWGESRFITDEKFARLSRYRVFAGDVMITIMGTTGRSAVVPDDIPVAIATKHLATLTLDRGKAEPEFVSQAIHSHPEVLAQISAANRGAIMSGLNLGIIRSLVLKLPPLELQRSFTLFTSKLRNQQRQVAGAVQDAERLFSSLLHRAFRGELSHPHPPLLAAVALGASKPPSLQADGRG
jgi:type I restriction enzyme, S subunit